MAVDERTRLALARKLDAVLGTDDASTLMEYLPPVGWTDIATKQDLATLETSLRGEIAELRGEMLQEMGGLRGEMGGLRAELADALKAQTNRILGWVVPTMLAGVGLAVAASNLG